MVRKHEMLPEGESTANWAIRDAGFIGTVKQLTHCARCGDPLPFKRFDEPRHFRDVFKPTFHCLCDECHEALPG